MVWRSVLEEDWLCGRDNITRGEGGLRLSVIRSTLSSLLVYMLFLFQVPRSVGMRLDQIKRNFCGVAVIGIKNTSYELGNNMLGKKNWVSRGEDP